MSYTRTQFDVFLAHNSSDKPQVMAIAEELKRRGLRPWLDDEQIPPGRSFQDEIQQAIPVVKSAAIFVGSQGLGRWQSWELKVFILQCVENKIPVIPVLLPGVISFPENLVFLRELRWIKFETQINDENILDLLVWGITGQKQIGEAIDSPQSNSSLFSYVNRENLQKGCIPILVMKNEIDKFDICRVRYVTHLWNYNEPFTEELQIIAANPDSYSSFSFEELVNKLYERYLLDRYDTYTYGYDWVLAKASSYVTLLALPWEWLRHKRQKRLRDTVKGYTSRSTPLKAFGFDAKTMQSSNSVWAIFDKGFENAYGLFTSNDDVALEGFDRYSKILYDKLNGCNSFSRLDEVNPENYKYKFVVFQGSFIDRKNKLPEDAVFVINDL